MAEESMGQDEGAEKSKLFKMVKDRGLSAQAKLLEWCATMDLIAIVTVENALYVYRWEFWERVWSTQAASSITALVWKPDGKILCTGDHDGRITLYDTETGGVLHSAANHSCAVTAVSWIQEQSSSSQLGVKDPTHHMLPKTRPLTSGVTVGEEQKKPLHGMSARITHAAQLDALISVDQKNQLVLCAFGSFLLMRLDLQQLCATSGLQAVQVERLQLSFDLGLLTVVLRPVTNPTQLLVARAYTWNVLTSRRKEIRELAVHAAHLRELTSTLATARADLATRYAAVLQPLQAKFEQLSSAASSHAVPGASSAWQDHLTMALACGTLSPAMMQFFGATSEPMLRRLLKTTEASLLSIQEDIIYHLQPVAELCVHHLSHFHALCQWKDSFTGLVPLREAVAKSLSDASALAVSLEQLLRLLDALRQDYKTLLEWLLRIQAKLNESQRKEIGAVDDVRIARFLEQYPQRENLVKMYLDHDASGISNPESLVSLAVHVPDILRGCAPGLAQGTHTIIEQLQRGSEKIFAEPFAAQANSIQLESVLTVQFAAAPTCVSLAYHPCEEKLSSRFVQYIAMQFGQHVGLLRCTVNCQAQTRVEKWSAAKLVSFPEDGLVQRVALYNAERLAVLLRIGEAAPGRYHSKLVLAPFDALPFSPISQPQFTFDSIGVQLLSVAASCSFAHQGEAEMLAVMAPPRGVGCVYTAARRLIIFDLLDETDEEGVMAAEEGEDKENQPAND